MISWLIHNYIDVNPTFPCVTLSLCVLHPAVNAPVITAQPVKQDDILEGSIVTFNVTAVGLMLVYQWQKNGVNIFNQAAIFSGTNTTMLTVFSVTDQDDGIFRVIVSNPRGYVTSNPVTLTVCK